MVPELLYTYITEASEYLETRNFGNVYAGVILGSGLSSVVDKFNIIEVIDYTEIPHLTGPSVESHSGKLFLAEHADKRVLIFSGRVHYYEGYDMWQVAFPVRIMSRLGASILITTRRGRRLESGVQGRWYYWNSGPH